MMTRKRAVDNFYQSLDKALDEGWKEFATEQNRRTALQIERMLRVLTALKGNEFVDQLRGFMTALKAKGSNLRVVRQPTGIKVKDRRFPLIPYIWVDLDREIEGDKYTYVCVQVKPERWLRFVVYK